MIESIYSNEQGETEQTSKVQTTYKMPKNIRQVGKNNSNKKIYLEDYVLTFIKQLTGGDFSGCKVAVLVGQCIKLENSRNIFISGAVEVKNVDFSNDVLFSNDAWTQIYEDIKKYFVETEIVGWFIGGPSYLLEEEEKIQKAHLNNFAGQDKTLMTYDNMEREEAFYIYESNRLNKQDGYYIYYEKNEEMQNYMIDHKNEPKPSNEADYDDRVSRDIRNVLQNKKPSQGEGKGITRLMYAAGTLLAVIVLVVGAAMLGNYDQMKNIQDTLNYLKKDMKEVQTIFAQNGYYITKEETTNLNKKKDKEKTKDVSAGADNGLNIEVLPGDVKPLEEDSAIQDMEDEEEKDRPISDGELAQEETSTDKAGTEKTNADKADTESVNTEKTNSESQGTKNTEADREVEYYTVVAGDTLAGISYKLYKTYTMVDELMEANNLSDENVILIGQKLIVP